MALKNKKSEEKPAKKEKFVPFEKQNIIHPLKLFISIVSDGQGDAIAKLMEKSGATFSFISNGEGTGKNYLQGFIPGSDIKKQIVFSFVRDDKTEEVREALETRFSTSKAAKGISISIRLSSVAGVSVYRFLTNTRKVRKVGSDDEI